MAGLVDACTVVSTVVALRLAYEGVGRCFRFWKSKKKKAQNSEQSAALEDSLRQVPDNIRRQYNNSCACLGPAFENLDGMSVLLCKALDPFADQQQLAQSSLFLKLSSISTLR